MGNPKEEAEEETEEEIDILEEEEAEELYFADDKYESDDELTSRSFYFAGLSEGWRKGAILWGSKLRRRWVVLRDYRAGLGL